MNDIDTNFDGFSDENSIDSQIHKLKDDVFKLRHETNFDINSSMKSVKELIRDEFQNCIAIATSIFAANYSRLKQNQINVPTFDPTKQTQKFDNVSIYYRKLYTSLFSNPDDFAPTVFDRINNDQIDINYFAFELMPIIHNYYIDETCCINAQGFLTIILGLFKDPKNTNQILKFFPLFQSFFLGAYNFHDLLWNQFYQKIISNPQQDAIFDHFLSSLSNASLSLTYQLPILESLLQISEEEGMKFIIANILKPSLMMYKELFNGTDVYQRLIDIFNSINYEQYDETLQKIHNSILTPQGTILKPINVMNISFDNGLTVPMLCSTMAKLLRFLKPEDPIIQSMSMLYETTIKSINELEKNHRLTIALNVFYPTAQIDDFSSNEKQCDAKMLFAWNQMKKTAEEACIDPLTLIPKLNESAEHTNSITDTSEFAQFALEREKCRLLKKKEAIAYIVNLTKTYRSIVNLKKTLESISFNTYNTYMHFIQRDHLGLGKDVKAFKIISTYKNSLKVIQKLGVPLEAGWVPLICTIFDKIMSMPSLSKITRKFAKVKWDFENKLLSQSRDTLDIIEDELRYLKSIMELIHLCPCGQQLVKLNYIANSLSTLQSVCAENGFNLTNIQLFAAIFPLDHGPEFIVSIIRLYQIRKLILNSGDPQLPKNLFEKLHLVNSWLMGLLNTEPDFEVDIYCREIDKVLS